MNAYHVWAFLECAKKMNLHHHGWAVMVLPVTVQIQNLFAAQLLVAMHVAAMKKLIVPDQCAVYSPAIP